MSTPQHPEARHPGAPDPYVYDPYGPSYPAPPEPPPRRRPGLMVLSLVLMIVAALPFLVLGLLFLVVPLNAGSLPPEVLDSPRLQQAGATPDLLISAFRLVAGVVLVASVLYLLFGVLAFAGRNWARIVTAVLTVGFALLLAAALVAGGGAVDTVAIAGLLLVVVLGAAAILFSPGVNAWYAHRR